MLSLILAVVAFASSSGNPTAPISQRVDLIELNHCYNVDGSHAYDQVIFYDWSPDYHRREVVAWKLVEDLPDYPQKQAGRHVVRWFDRDARRARIVASLTFIETTTTHDPERAAKFLQDEKYRIGLLRGTVSILEPN